MEQLIKQNFIEKIKTHPKAIQKKTGVGSGIAWHIHCDNIIKNFSTRVIRLTEDDNYYYLSIKGYKSEVISKECNLHNFEFQSLTKKIETFL